MRFNLQSNACACYRIGIETIVFYCQIPFFQENVIPFSITVYTNWAIRLSYNTGRNPGNEKGLSNMWRSMGLFLKYSAFSISLHSSYSWKRNSFPTNAKLSIGIEARNKCLRSS